VRSLAAPASLIDDLGFLVQERHPGDHDATTPIFVTRAGTALSYTNWRTRSWLPATRAAELPNLRFHDLRSLAATALVAAGADLRTAMRRLGHTTPAMTLAVYANVAADRDREAADAVPDRIGGPRRSSPHS